MEISLRVKPNFNYINIPFDGGKITVDRSSEVIQFLMPLNIDIFMVTDSDNLPGVKIGEMECYIIRPFIESRITEAFDEFDAISNSTMELHKILINNNCFIDEQEPTKSMLYIEKFKIDNEHRGMSIGGSVLNALFDLLYSTLNLIAGTIILKAACIENTDKESDDSIDIRLHSFYSRNGFEKVKIDSTNMFMVRFFSNVNDQYGLIM